MGTQCHRLASMQDGACKRIPNQGTIVDGVVFFPSGSRLKGCMGITEAPPCILGVPSQRRIGSAIACNRVDRRSACDACWCAPAFARPPLPGEASAQRVGWEDGSKALAVLRVCASLCAVRAWALGPGRPSQRCSTRRPVPGARVPLPARACFSAHDAIC
jgi:hypothetical protein